MKKSLVVLAMLAATLPGLAAILTPYVAGDFQGWDAGLNPMTETAPGSGIWTATFGGMDPNSRHEFKITDGTWNNSFPGANSWLYSDGAGDVTITYDTNIYADGWSPTTERLGLTTDPGAWTAVGDFQSEVGGGDWDNANPATMMQPQGGGIYMLEAVLPAGTYNWKAAVTGSWDSISWDARSINTANWEFTTDDVNNTARFWVNALAGTVKIDVVPEPGAMVLMAVAGLLRRR